jgi:hypothetical protein
MKIEEGKYYRTRDGDVVGPMAAVYGCDDAFTAIGHTWNEDGSFVRGNPYKLDLISEVYVSDTPPTVQETEEELREMMRDPRYWQKRKPEWVKRVTEGFRALIGGDTPPADAPATETKTLRDEFAMAALNGAMVGYHDKPSAMCDNIAKWSYDVADAMMGARKK